MKKLQKSYKLFAIWERNRNAQWTKFSECYCKYPARPLKDHVRGLRPVHDLHLAKAT